MKLLTPIVCIFALVAVNNLYGKRVLYEWTGKEENAKTFKAEFISANDETVTIRAKGKTYVMTISSLSPKSKAQVKKLRDEKAEDDFYNKLIWWAIGGIVGLMIIMKVKMFFAAANKAGHEMRQAGGKATWKAPWKKAPTWSWALLQDLEWKRFEEVVCAYYHKLGHRTDTTRMGADGGVDVMLYDNETGQPVAVIQCKAWSNKVGVKPVRELLGVMTANQVNHGIFVTTSDYTGEAKEFASGVAGLELIDGYTLLSRIQKLPPDKRDSLLETATLGDYTTPTCPNCNVKMVSREAKKGANAGSVFWGCRNYPRCKQTFKQT